METLFAQFDADSDGRLSYVVMVRVRVRVRVKVRGWSHCECSDRCGIPGHIRGRGE